MKKELEILLNELIFIYKIIDDQYEKELVYFYIEESKNNLLWNKNFSDTHLIEILKFIINEFRR